MLRGIPIYIDDVEAMGARVKFIGGIRPGRCSTGHRHPCGKALDVCRRSRGIVDPDCHLPGRAMLAAIAIKNGLFEGGLWCNSDYGHVQVGISAEACAQSIYASAKKLVIALLSKKDETVVDEAKVFDYSLVSVANADEVKVEKVAARAHHRRVNYASRRRHRATVTYAARSHQQQYAAYYGYAYQPRTSRRHYRYAYVMPAANANNY